MKVIIHAGTHKTGTTSIQRVLSENLATLAEAGVYYPLFGPYSKTHHKFSHDATGVDPVRLNMAKKFARSVIKNAGPDTRIVLISAEPIYRHVDGVNTWDNYGDIDEYWPRRACYLRRLTSFFEGHDVEALLFLRKPDDFMRSLRNELIKKGSWDGPDEAFQKEFSVLQDYERQLHAFESAFPTVKVKSYEHCMEEGSVLPAFFRSIGVPLPEGAQQVWDNASK